MDEKKRHLDMTEILSVGRAHAAVTLEPQAVEQPDVEDRQIGELDSQQAQGIRRGLG